LLTPEGERKIEDLRIGDPLMTLSGEARPIEWIGRSVYRLATDCRYPASVLPVRIAMGALGPNLPHCDLFTSQHHAMWVDGLFIKAIDLVNGSSITVHSAIETSEIEYLHVKLARHDVIFAEGAPSETVLVTPETLSVSTTSQSTCDCMVRLKKRGARRLRSKIREKGVCRTCAARCPRGSIVATSSTRLVTGLRSLWINRIPVEVIEQRAALSPDYA
jgi:hypothetical protein